MCQPQPDKFHPAPRTQNPAQPLPSTFTFSEQEPENIISEMEKISHFRIIPVLITVLVPCVTLVEAIETTTYPHYQQPDSGKPRWGWGPVGSVSIAKKQDDFKSFKKPRRRRRPQPTKGWSQEQTRTFAIPSGTVFKLTPEIKIPISKSEDEAITCTSEFAASFPISITFKDMSWRKMAQELFVLDPLRRRTSFWDPSYFGHSDSDNIVLQSVHGHHRQSRDLSFLHLFNQTNVSGNTLMSNVKSGKCPVKSLTDRKSILEEVEIAGLRMFGMDSNPKACLLRAICEMHEAPIYYELGLLGEAVTVTFSFEEISRECEDDPEHLLLMTYLRPYIRAEVAGRSGECQAYHETCPQSIFTYA